MSVALKPFPNVDEAAISAAGTSVSSTHGTLDGARSTTVTVASTATWQSQSAHPSWDAALAARARDLSAAAQVMEHVGNVLSSTGARVALLRSQYTSLVQSRGILEHQAGATGGPTDADVDALTTQANTTADDAVRLIGLAAQQLVAVTEGVTFAAPPMVPCYADPSIYVVADPMASGSLAPVPSSVADTGGIVMVNGEPEQFTTGKRFETDILRQLGIDEQTKAFFRPGKDETWSLPKTKSGLYRGTFPDSMIPGILEIKSGTTRICLSDGQMEIQQWVSQQTGKPWSLIVSNGVPVDEAIKAATQASGGSVYYSVPGHAGVFYDANTGDYVRLDKGADQLDRSTMDSSEVQRIDAKLRAQIEAQAKVIPDCKPSPNAPAGAAALTLPETQPYEDEQEWQARQQAAGKDGQIHVPYGMSWMPGKGDVPAGTPGADDPVIPEIPDTPAEMFPDMPEFDPTEIFPELVP